MKTRKEQIAKRQKGITYYSAPVKKGLGNYDDYRFDVTDGYVGITSHPDAENRVLLSPAQFAALVAFVCPASGRL